MKGTEIMLLKRRDNKKDSIQGERWRLILHLNSFILKLTGKQEARKIPQVRFVREETIQIEPSYIQSFQQ